MLTSLAAPASRGCRAGIRTRTAKKPPNAISPHSYADDQICSCKDSSRTKRRQCAFRRGALRRSRIERPGPSAAIQRAPPRQRVAPVFSCEEVRGHAWRTHLSFRLHTPSCEHESPLKTWTAFPLAHVSRASQSRMQPMAPFTEAGWLLPRPSAAKTDSIPAGLCVNLQRSALLKATPVSMQHGLARCASPCLPTKP
jgi:hypothetical protein